MVALLTLTFGCFGPSAPPCVNGLELGERVLFQVVEPFDETSRYMYLPTDRRPGMPGPPPCGLESVGLAEVEVGERFELRTDEIDGDAICVVYKCPDDLPTESMESLNGGRATIGSGATLCHNGERDVDLGGGCIARRAALLQSVAGVGTPRIEGQRPPTIFTRYLRVEAGECPHVPGLSESIACTDSWVVDTVAPVD